jgi:hypothetical protein
MSITDPRIDQFLSDLRVGGRSSPAGIHWQHFHELLQAKRRAGHGNPPLPLILAASGESDGSKHRRLSSQLQWALENGSLDDALKYLQRLPVEHWNSCASEQWDQDSY